MGIERPTFTATRIRMGYHPGQVDDAVDRVLAALASPEPAIGPDEVEALRFETVSYREGYEIEQVDDWLSDVLDELRRRRSPGAVEAAPGPTAYAPVTRSDAIVEVRSDASRWLAALAVVAVLAVLVYVALV